MQPTSDQLKRLQLLKKIAVCHSPGAQDIFASNARVERINLLYEISGRTCRTFSGLSAEADLLGF